MNVHKKNRVSDLYNIYLSLITFLYLFVFIITFTLGFLLTYMFMLYMTNKYVILLDIIPNYILFEVIPIGLAILLSFNAVMFIHKKSNSRSLKK